MSTFSPTPTQRTTTARGGHRSNPPTEDDEMGSINATRQEHNTKSANRSGKRRKSCNNGHTRPARRHTSILDSHLNIGRVANTINLPKTSAGYTMFPLSFSRSEINVQEFSFRGRAMLETPDATLYPSYSPRPPPKDCGKTPDRQPTPALPRVRPSLRFTLLYIACNLSYLCSTKAQGTEERRREVFHMRGATGRCVVLCRENSRDELPCWLRQKPQSPTYPWGFDVQITAVTL